jgi:hypothetical protein
MLASPSHVLDAEANYKYDCWNECDDRRHSLEVQRIVQQDGTAATQDREALQGLTECGCPDDSARSEDSQSEQGSSSELHGTADGNQRSASWSEPADSDAR